MNSNLFTGMILSWFSGFCFEVPGYDKIDRVACSWKMSPFDTPKVAEVDFSQEVESLPWFVFVLIAVHLGCAFLSLPPLCLELHCFRVFYRMCSGFCSTVLCFSFQSSVAFFAISVISFPWKGLRHGPCSCPPETSLELHVVCFELDFMFWLLLL